MLKTVWNTFAGGFTSLIANWQSYLAIAAISGLLGAAGTWRVMSWKEAAAQTHVAQQAVRLVMRQEALTLNISMNFEAIKTSDQAATNKLLDEVEIHVTPAIDLDHPVPCGFVRLFNAAAHDPVPDTACGPDDAASGVALSTVAKTTVQDFGQYDIIAHQLTALQDWVTQQEALTNK